MSPGEGDASSELVHQLESYKKKIENESDKPDQYLDAEVGRLEEVFKDCHKA